MTTSVLVPDPSAAKSLPYAMSPSDLAAEVGIDRSTWYRHFMPYVRTKKIKSFRIGRALRIVVASFFDFVTEQEAKNG